MSSHSTGYCYSNQLTRTFPAFPFSLSLWVSVVKIKPGKRAERISTACSTCPRVSPNPSCKNRRSSFPPGRNWPVVLPGLGQETAYVIFPSRGGNENSEPAAQRTTASTVFAGYVNAEARRRVSRAIAAPNWFEGGVSLSLSFSVWLLLVTSWTNAHGRK